MFIPLLLLGFAVLSAGVVAYGIHPFWAQYAHGVDLIVWSRRLEWPLVVLCLVLCLALLFLIVSGKRRAWWLIGLGPILALFVHRFVTDPAGGLAVVENPTFVAADASTIPDDDYVVGLHFGDVFYAYPYSILFDNPVILQSDHEKRMMLMWSAFANRAVGQTINRDVRARDIEIVSMPANAMLLYNRADGQFINALTGQLMNGKKPIGFGAPVVLSTTTWKQWRDSNPQTKIMQPPAAAAHRTAAPPHGPIEPAYPMPPAILDYPANNSIVLIGTTQPAALKADDVGPEPQRVQVDGGPAFVFRESPGKPIRAFSCYLKKQELFPRFRLDRQHKFKGSMFIDSDTGSAWSANGLWVGGQYKKEMQGSRLLPLPVQDRLYWGVMKFWYPQLTLSTPEREDKSTVTSGS